MIEPRIKKSVLVLLDGMPSKENPACWSHVLDQVFRLSEECEITLISPVCLTISIIRFRKNRDRIKKLPEYRYRIGSTPCWRPRYIDISLIPWKYRKHYFRIWTMIVSLLFLIFRQRIHFDIIHAHFVYRPGYVAAILGKILGKPVVITAHGSDIHQNLFMDRENILLRKRTISAMKRSSRIIAVSEYLKKSIAEEGFSEKTCVIPCGFSEKQFYPVDKKESRIRLSLQTGRKILLFVGNLVFIKGVDVLIESLGMLRNKDDNIELIVIGDGHERRALEQQSRDCGVEKKIHFLGRKDKREIPLYINSSDSIVVPSRDEGRSLVILEALACGKPVVASRVGGIPETVVNDRLGILVEKENPVALADGISKALVRSWDDKYQADYVGKYTNTRIVPEILKVYGELH